MTPCKGLLSQAIAMAMPEKGKGKVKAKASSTNPKRKLCSTSTTKSGSASKKIPLRRRKRKRRVKGSRTRQKSSSLAAIKDALRSRRRCPNAPTRRRRRRRPPVRRSNAQDKDADFVVDDEDQFENDDDEWVSRPKKKPKICKGKQVIEDEDDEFVVESSGESEPDEEFISESENSSNDSSQIDENWDDEEIDCTSGLSETGVESHRNSIQEFDASEQSNKNSGPGELKDLNMPIVEADKTSTVTKSNALGKSVATEEETTVVCGICLSESNEVEQGKLDCCDHFFCFPCIVEWSKVESRCPLCKQRFVSIKRPVTAGHSRSRTVRVPMRNQVYVPSEEDVREIEDPYEATVCIECNEPGSDNLLLLCDGCDSAAHTYCVGLGRSVPSGDWYCRICQECNNGYRVSSTSNAVRSRSGHNNAVNHRAQSARRTSAIRTLRQQTRSERMSQSVDYGSFPGQDPVGEVNRERKSTLQAMVPCVKVALEHPTVQDRIQQLRENWEQYRSGQLEFPSTSSSGVIFSNGCSSSQTLHEESGLASSTRDTSSGNIKSKLPSSDANGSMPIKLDVPPRRADGQNKDMDKAWEMMEQARMLATFEGGSISSRSRPNVKEQTTKHCPFNRSSQLVGPSTSVQNSERELVLGPSSRLEIKNNSKEKLPVLRLKPVNVKNEEKPSLQASYLNKNGMPEMLENSSGDVMSQHREGNIRMMLDRDQAGTSTSGSANNEGFTSDDKHSIVLPKYSLQLPSDIKDNKYFLTEQGVVKAKILSNGSRSVQGNFCAGNVGPNRGALASQPMGSQLSQNHGGASTSLGSKHQLENVKKHSQANDTRLLCAPDKIGSEVFGENQIQASGPTSWLGLHDRKKIPLRKGGEEENLIVGRKFREPHSLGPEEMGSAHKKDEDECRHSRSVDTNVKVPPQTSTKWLGSQAFADVAAHEADKLNAESSDRNEERKLIKKQILNIIKDELKPWYTKHSIDKNQYKEIARTATHSLLAKCAPEHSMFLLETEKTKSSGGSLLQIAAKQVVGDLLKDLIL